MWGWLEGVEELDDAAKLPPPRGGVGFAGQWRRASGRRAGDWRKAAAIGAAATLRAAATNSAAVGSPAGRRLEAGMGQASCAQGGTTGQSSLSRALQQPRRPWSVEGLPPPRWECLSFHADGPWSALSRHARAPLWPTGALVRRTFGRTQAAGYGPPLSACPPICPAPGVIIGVRERPRTAVVLVDSRPGDFRRLTPTWPSVSWQGRSPNRRRCG